MVLQCVSSGVSYPINLYTSGLGATTTSGLILTNTSAATLGTQQLSPSIQVRGYGWETNTGSSMPVDARMYMLPVQGTSAPTGTFITQYRINDGSWTNLYQCTTAGNFTAQGSVFSGGTGGTGTLYGSTLAASGGTSAGLGLAGRITSGATAIAVKIYNVNELTHAGAKICSFYKDNLTTEKAYIDKDGIIYQEATKRVACGGGTTGGAAAAAGYVELEINGTTYKLLYMA